MKNIFYKTSGYATWFTAGGAIRIAHYDVVDDVITRKNGTTSPMKSSELSNGENRIAVRQLLQKIGNDVIYDVIIWVQDGNCKKWLERILVLVRSTI